MAIRPYYAGLTSTLFASTLLVTASGDAPRGQGLASPRPADIAGVRLAPTAHAPLPSHPSLLWLVPEAPASARGAVRGTTADPAGTALARGIRAFDQADYAGAVTQLRGATSGQGALGEYALYYLGWAQLRLSRLDEAAGSFDLLDQRKPTGHLAEALPQRQAELGEAKNDFAAAVRRLEPLTGEKTTAPHLVLMQLARLADAAGDRDKALAAYRRVYYEYPLSDEATIAGSEIARLEVPRGADVAQARFALDMGRAERLFGGRRYAQARDGFEALRPLASGDDAELVALRLAECDYYLRRFGAARDGVRPFLEKASRKAEARFFYLTAIRSLGDDDTYITLARQLVADFPDSSWAEEALNNLASHFIIANDDAEADRVFRELYARFPEGRYAERAAWKIGWWSYKNGAPADTVKVFEGAAARFPRSDYRPSWIYWAARAYDQSGDPATAAARYRLVVTDYQNTYYGRLAARRLEGSRLPAADVVAAVDAGGSADGPAPATVSLPPTDQRIRDLLALELYDQAERELSYAQRVWGDSPAVQATLGWIYYRRGDLRRGINAMRRAYPQYMAEGGEDLPPDLLRVLFPLDYWPLIRKYATAHRLDPFVVAALINQESTFTPDARSSANAIGLMQLLPTTGRRYARRIGIRRFSARTLTQPEANIRIGTAYFSDLVKRFGGAHFALASYNAGENRITRWQSERPGLEQDEFIDDIPFPETQNYVKRILGQAEDYRRLYGDGIVTAAGHAAPQTPASVSKARAAKAKAASKKPTKKPVPAKKKAPRKPR